MQHLDEGTIHAWLDGALSEDEAAHVEQHVATCDECSARVAEARGLIAGASRIASSLDNVRGDVLPKAKPAPHALWNRLHLSPSRAALAATALIAVSSLLVIRHAPTARQSAVLAEAASPGASPVPSPIPAPVSPPSSAGAADSLSKKAAPAATAAAASNKASSNARAVAGAERVIAPDTAKAAAAGAERDFSGKRVAIASAKDSARTVRSPSADSVALPRATGFDPRTLKPHDANPASQLPLNAPGRRIGAGQTLQLSEVVATATGSTAASSAPRCYMIVPDTSELSRTLPDRFALTLSTPDSARVVRSVTADGRIDGVVRDATWRPAGVGMTRVDFQMVGSRFAPSIFTIRDGQLRAQASSASTSWSISIRPIDCHE